MQRRMSWSCRPLATLPSWKPAESKLFLKYSTGMWTTTVLCDPRRNTCGWDAFVSCLNWIIWRVHGAPFCSFLDDDGYMQYSHAHLPEKNFPSCLNGFFSCRLLSPALTQGPKHEEKSQPHAPPFLFCWTGVSMHASHLSPLRTSTHANKDKMMRSQQREGEDKKKE